MVALVLVLSFSLVTAVPVAAQMVPTVTSISPNSGPIAGETPVTITGTNFVVGATVHIGTTPVWYPTVVSDTSITATTPPHTAGAFGVVVTNPGVVPPGLLADGFTYYLPLPAHSTYAFEYTVPDPIVVNEDIVVPVTFATNVLGDVGYDAVIFSFAATGPGDVTFTATDTESNVITQTNSGVWGPEGGFALPDRKSVV